MYMKRLKKGLTQIYTGNGKGKTTAAVGLALRAGGAGLRVYICQFIKGKSYSEIKILKKTQNIFVEQFGRGCFIRRKPAALDGEYAEEGLKKAKRQIASGKYDIVVLDEINVALKLGLVKIDKIIELIRTKPRHVELVLDVLLADALIQQLRS